MRPSGRTLPWLAAALVAVSSSDARAATHCVNPLGSGGCNTSVANAVTSSAAGDTVTIAPGVYRETSQINVGVNDLKIIGPATAIIDPEANAGLNPFVPLYVSGSHVSVTGVTFRNSDVDAIQVSGDHFTLTNVSINGTNGNCLTLLAGADFATVKGSKLRNCGSSGIVFGDSTPTLVNNLTVIASSLQNLGNIAIHGWGDAVAITGTIVSVTGAEGIWIEEGTTPLVKSTTLRNTYASGLRLGGSAAVSGAIVSQNKLSALDGTGISITGDAPTVTNNTITTPYGVGIFLDGGVGAVVKYNIISGADGYGVEGTGGTTGANVSNNTISASSDIAIYMDSGSDGAKVGFNRITGHGGADAIEVYGDSASVTSNNIKNSNAGIYVNGGGAHLVSSNVVAAGADTGVEVYCAGCSAGPILKANRVTDAAAGGYGVSVYSDAVGGIVQSNIVTRANANGFYIDGMGITIQQNQTIDSGYPGTSGFSINGSDHILTSNIARGSSGDGFHVLASDCTLTSNTADHSGEDGFDIHGPNAILTSNHANYSNGSGFEIEAGVGGTLTGNAVIAAGTGLCNAGGATIGAGNNFGLLVADPPVSGQCDAASGYVGD